MSDNVNQPALKIVPLGGLHEIGKNTCVLEYDDEILLIDAGIGFPSDDMHGVNVVLPDMTYLRENRHKIKGMVVTHGHEDHIGGIPYHLKQFDIPVIYGPRLAMALLHNKLEEAALSDRTAIKSVLPRDTVRIGRSFFIEFIRNTHSIADSCCLAIHTPLGVVVHTGDFKIDHTPVDGEHFDLHRLAEHGTKGVLCLLSDSTNAEVPGHTPSEQSVRPNLDRIFATTNGRLLVTTFASSIHRVRILLELAAKHGRVVSVVGRSMLNTIAHARNLGYINCKDDLFVPFKGLNKYPDEKVLILTTGSQGEPLAALTRISRGEHQHIKIREGDTVVFSANPIPGNTIAVVNTIDRLMMQGANVLYGRHLGIHVSGHGSQEDHKLMLALVKPKFFVPVHGEHRMLVKHAAMARSVGIPQENMVVINNGDIVEVTADRIGIGGQVPSGIELVDRSGIVHKEVLRDRQQLAQDGTLVVAAVLDGAGKFLAPPQVSLHGVVTPIATSAIQSLVARTVTQLVDNRWSEFVRSSNRGANGIDWAGLRAELESSIQRLVRRELRSQPLVALALTAVGADAAIEAVNAVDAAANGNAKGKIAGDSTTGSSANGDTNGNGKSTGRRRRRSAAMAAS
ncbi:putative hydrolase of the metallo-beta-lactamase superfamily [Rubidibacter lacunae KORDI 51-2]|uniref:Ribonuclease J n=1 Tax=Rubidibacter lacunae KORDI 51-2 TaxID=582515 RepID=U5DQR0_9CHRO|nr:ribonuclease J [Rubidibacter lacunae]ERN43162.1 putative hydrolase of the metallo-beta-lactamase superfamily [Rubidibacter lacunae KORDI 51-2]